MSGGRGGLTKQPASPFEDIGLDQQSLAVYRRLLREPAVTARDLAASLGWDLRCVEASLEVLSQLALIRGAWPQLGQLQPVHPELGLGGHLARQQAELAGKNVRVQQALGELNMMIDAYRERADESAGAEILRLDGAGDIRGWLEMSRPRIQSEVLAFVTPHPAAAPMSAGRRHDEALLQRGVTIKSIYLDSIVNSREAMEYLSWMSDKGAELRSVPTLPISLTIHDRNVALLPMDQSDPARGALAVTGCSLLTPLIALFEHCWSFAAEFLSGKHCSADGIELTPQEVELLRLLARGSKDESIGRALGLSVRTVRRMIGSLSARLEAASRFELGVRAERSGLV
ncbi:MAG: hypothetical protein QOK10_2809 [Pseudonocardiales bacterium]|jgi:DNA-binding CsgD family transcriptional regulator|nr:hypothetical protein [Pseudonocardiales bacterium]